MNKAFEKILERLEKERIILLKNNLHQAIALNFAKKIVQEVAEEYNVGWIACSERLPKGSMNNVLCQFYDGRIDTISMEHLRYEVNNESGYCVAWRPLPEPFKESD